VTEGTVYPILGRLARDGVLKAEWISDEGPHPRKYYRLTDRGRRTLNDMLAHWNTITQKIERLIKAAQRAEE
jgi:PadR family transcriptional regulator PadR